MLGFKQFILGPLGGREWLSTRDASPPGSRTHASHGREDFRHPSGGLARPAPRIAGNGGGVSSGQDCLFAQDRDCFPTLRIGFKRIEFLKCLASFEKRGGADRRVTYGEAT